jgi:dienelactone hydrolase
MTSHDGLSRREALQVLSTLAVAAAAGPETVRSAEGPARVLPPGQLPDDVRLGALKDLNGYFPWEPSPNVAAWNARSADVRRRILVACGLWPMPTRPRVEPIFTKKVERPGYTVEGVVFESHAGLYVTGSLYRPTDGTGPRPGVLCPHGHWANGRFHDHGADKIVTELETKAEEFAVGGRHPLQARCVHLARMGCTVFLYDMLGYGDNHILPFELIHGFAKQQPERSAIDQWGLFSAQAELRCLNPVGLQTWNSIRVLDFFEQLPDVDPKRIGVTGASGGGTQTFLLGAIDPRPMAFFPAVMVSTAMQGGCTCENASLLRVDTGNIEFAALLAPRRLGLTGANDWTKEIETKGLPQLHQHYAMLGAAENVSGKYQNFEHNYNHPSRRMMYEMFRETFGLTDVSVEEEDFIPLTKEEATVWTAEHPMPTPDYAAERQIVQSFADEFAAHLLMLAPSDPETFARYKEIFSGGWETLIGRSRANVGDVETTLTQEAEVASYGLQSGTIRNVTHHEALPYMSLIPKDWNRQIVLWMSDSGKGALLDGAGKPTSVVQGLLDRGFVVAAADFLYQGEFLSDGESMTEARRVNNPREFLGYTLGYNHALCAQRMHDAMTLVHAAKQHASQPTQVHVVGVGMGAIYGAAAVAMLGTAVSQLVLDPGQFRFAEITEIRDPRMLPGAVRYGDVTGLLSLRAPQLLTVVNDPALAEKLATTYAAAGSPGNLMRTTSLDFALSQIKA